MEKDLKFIEIEHKFLVDSSFDRLLFEKKILALNFLEKKTKITVDDTYIVTAAYPRYIYRHRIDAELQQLSLKSMGEDSETRVEVNLNLLPQSTGNQLENALAFLQGQQIRGVYPLRKKVWAYYFPDMEIVYYEASYKEKTLNCVEFESKYQGTQRESINAIERYEKLLDFHPTSRSHKSLFDLLVLPELSDFL